MLSSVLAISFSLFLFGIHEVIGPYEVEVTFHSYHNPSGRCDGCRQAVNPDPGCCDESFIRASEEVCPQENTCDTTVDYCLRPLGSRGDGCPDNQLVSSDFAYSEINSYNLFAPEFFGLDNPLLLIGNSSWTGIQLFLQSKDAIIVNHGFSDSVLIDSFSIDIDSPVGVSSPEANTYIGNASIAQVNVSFEVRCADNYYGGDCLTLCLDFQSCLDCGLSGFNGTFCQFNIDDCEEIVCNDSNSHCVDEINDYTCECDFGFTGEGCEEVIDFCLDVTCSGNGMCMGSLGSFTCACASGYSGALCEGNVEDCGTTSCSGNGVCVDGVGSFRCVCSAGFTGGFCEMQISNASGDADGSSGGSNAAYAGGLVGGLVASLILLILVCALLNTFCRALKKRGKLKHFGDLDDKVSHQPPHEMANGNSNLNNKVSHQPPHEMANGNSNLDNKEPPHEMTNGSSQCHFPSASTRENLPKVRTVSFQIYEREELAIF